MPTKKQRHIIETDGGLLAPFGYYYVKELPLSQLYSVYSEHRRLQVFVKKGCSCVVPGCQMVGTRLIVGAQTRHKDGTLLGLHVDLYAQDPHTGQLVMMTVDHIHPASQGGKNVLENYQPMCRAHNTEKKDMHPDEHRELVMG